MESSQLLTAAGRPENTDKVRMMFDAIARRYDLLNTVLSCGLHRVWESRLVRELPECSGGRCLDLCTGTGALVPLLVRRYSEVVGIDISTEMLNVARKRWSRLPNVTWCEGDAQGLACRDGEFDAVTVAYGVRNWPDFRTGLVEVLRVIRPGGSVGILEFGQPRNALWRWCFGLYSRYVIPTLGGLVSGTRAPYEYLPKTSAVFPCGEDFEVALNEVGFSSVRRISLLGGVAHIYIAAKV
jgi:demethylmenaquinone methyltransferase/2-methoxy-6-polyprenyl-1,4-benzoquinol methylase